jgi:cell division protein FtsB
MLSYVEKRKMRTVIYSPWVAVLLLGLLIVSGRAAWGMYDTYTESVAKRIESEREWGILTEREKELRNSIERLSHERGIEEEIREKYMVAKEGERVLVVTDAPDQEDREIDRTQRVSPHWWTPVLAAIGLGGE